MHADENTAPGNPTAAVKPRPWALVAYFLLFALAAGVTVGWLDPESRQIDFDLVFPEFYSHTSNLVLSTLLVLAFGMYRLFTGGRLRATVVFALIVIACNYVYELLLPLWNVKDPVDAHYGAVGALVALAWAAATHRWGVPRGASDPITA